MQDKRTLKHKHAGLHTSAKHMQHVVQFIFLWGDGFRVEGSCHQPQVLIFFTQTLDNSPRLPAVQKKRCHRPTELQTNITTPQHI